MRLAGVTIDLLEADDAIDLIVDRSLRRQPGVLAVDLVTLEHVHHFGSGRASANQERQALNSSSRAGHVTWLSLLADPRLAKWTYQLTGRLWPSITGQELSRRALDEAQSHRLRLGFLSAAPERRQDLEHYVAGTWPMLLTPRYWTAGAEVLDDHETARQLADRISRTSLDILLVGLGKPRQERWIAEHGGATRAPVCLALGSVLDELAVPDTHQGGTAGRPGLERAWWHVQDRGRAAHQRLVRHPSAYRALRGDSFVITPKTTANDTSVGGAR